MMLELAPFTPARPDPERRADGRCACGCGKKLVKLTKRHRRYGGDALLVDPFATTECAKAFHGVDITRTSFDEGRGQNGYLYEWLNDDGMTLPAGDERHGTPNAYRYHKCRCHQCRAANTQRERERRAQRVAA